ncbi:Uncharacterised protein [uncultured archaeon]|nr:Uncharacterised protein [uncultured archaeon]
MENIQAQLKDIEFEVKSVEDFWDYEENMGLFCSLVYNEIHKKDNMIWINLSSGSKLHGTIGLTVAQMFGFYNNQQKAFPYYVRADGYRPQNSKDFKLRGSAIVPELNETNEGFIITPPLFPTEKPDIKELELLEKLTCNTRVRIKDLRKLVEGSELKDTTSAKAARLNRLIGPLIEKGFVQAEGRTRSTRYELTKKGESYLRSFRPLLALYRSEPEFKMG